MFKKDKSTKAVFVLTLLALAVSQIQAACKNNEKRAENKAACAGHHYAELVPYPGDCSKYLVCRPVCEYPAVKQCPAGLWWDNRYKFCNLPKFVDCNDRVVETTIKTQARFTTTGYDTRNAKGRCNSEPRLENQQACAGQQNGARVSYPGDCTKFLVCVHYCDYPIVVQCPDDLWWDKTRKYCNLPVMTTCDNSVTETTTAISTSTTNSGDTTRTTKGRCNNEPRLQNEEACAGQQNGARVPYPGDCTKFLVCVNYCDYPVVVQCPADLWWDKTRKYCNLPVMTNCDNSVAETTTAMSTSTTKSADTTRTTEGKCNSEPRLENQQACDGQQNGARVPYPGDCTKFLVCVNYCDYPVVVQCPADLWWDKTRKYCNLPVMTNCDNSVAETTTDISTSTTNSGDTTQTTEGKCNNEARLKNLEACVGQQNGAMVSYPGDCTKFLVCVHYCDYPIVVQCPADLWWDNTYKHCNTPLLVDCKNSSGTTTPLDKTTAKQTTTSPTTTATESGIWGNDCVAPEGMSADICLNYNNKFLIKYPFNCNAYINCTMGCPVMTYCQADKVFNSVLKICDTRDVNDCDELPLSGTITTEKPIITTLEISLSPNEICRNEDLGTTFPYKQNCQRFIYCNGTGGFLILSCPYGNYYSINSRNCVSGDYSEICH